MLFSETPPLKQEDPLIDVFGFLSRDDLDTSLLAYKFWRDLVCKAAGKLALRPFQRVSIVCTLLPLLDNGW